MMDKFTENIRELHLRAVDEELPLADLRLRENSHHLWDALSNIDWYLNLVPLLQYFTSNEFNPHLWHESLLLLAQKTIDEAYKQGYITSKSTILRWELFGSHGVNIWSTSVGGHEMAICEVFNDSDNTTEIEWLTDDTFATAATIKEAVDACTKWLYQNTDLNIAINILEMEGVYQV